MIALIGAHGTGKSTILNELKKVTSDYYITDGFGRPLKEAGESLNLSPRDIQVIVNTITKHRWNNDVVQDKLICTRSIIDEWVYSKIFGFDEFLEERKEIFRNSDYTKSKYFYIPIEFPLEEDGVRYSGIDLQRQCDELMRQWIKEFNLEVVILTGTVKERLTTLINNI
jgi:predicted ATPase